MSDLAPLYVHACATVSLGATVMVGAWGLHKGKVPHAPAVVGLAACFYFMLAAKDWPTDTARALLRFGLVVFR